MRRYSILILLIFAMAVSAQKFTVSAPRHVDVGDQFPIEYSVNTQNVKNFRLENIPDELEILYGPSKSSQSSFQIVNGHMSSSSSITYSFVAVLKKKGNYSLPTARANVDGKNVISASYHISASGNSHVTASNGYSGSAHRSQGEDDAITDHRSQNRNNGDDIFIRVTASKKRVREQEPILLTYKVYTIPNLVNLDYKMPELKGFYTQEIMLPKAKTSHRETFNGQVYNCVVWSQFVLYPQTTGKLTIPSLTFNGTVMRENRDPFAFITGGGYEEEKREIKASGITILVDRLPEKPEHYSGGVGRFNISCQLNKTETKAGEPINLRLVIGGSGNLKLIKQPEVTFPQHWDKYDAKVIDKTRITSNGVEGNMVYDILAVPRKAGTYTIPSVKFVYFDTTTNTYKTIQSQPLTVSVQKGDGKENGDISDFSSNKDEDIRGIKTGDAKLYDVNDMFFNTVWYWSILFALLAILALLIYLFRRTVLQYADIELMRRRKANKLSTTHLRKAEDLKNANKSLEFYDEVLRALWGYVSYKLNIPVEQLSRDNISERLAEHNVDDATIGLFISALDECEYERYAPGDAKGNMNKTFNAAMSAINTIENSVKNTKSPKGFKMRFLMVLVTIMLSLSVNAITKNNADTEYNKGNYQQAIKDYEELLENGVSYEIYHNLGNAYYRTDNIPRAILSYERALWLSPYDADVKFNLQMAQSKTIDKLTPKSEMFFVEWYKALVNMLSVDGWAYTAIISVILAIMLVLMYLFSERILFRRIGFWGIICALILFVLSNVFAFQQCYYLNNKTGAIVMASSVTVKKTPQKNASELFVLHEGTKVEIIDKVKNWVDVKISDGREGWIETSKIEEI